MKNLFFLLFLVSLSCKPKSQDDFLPFLRIVLKNTEFVTIQGKVSGPGTVKNADVSVLALPSTGRCVTAEGKPNGSVLASAKTNEKGEYTLTYPKVGGTPCLVVTASEGTVMEVSYGSKRSIPWSGNHLFSVFQEPKTFKRNSNNQLIASKTLNANPFTRLASSRFLASRNIQNSSKNKNFLSKLRSLITKSKTQEELLETAYKQTIQTFFKGIDSKNFKLDEANPDSKLFQARLGAIKTYSERLGLPKGAPKTQYTGNIDPQNLAKVLNFMDRDFSDGSFDGKEVNENGEFSQISLADLEELELNFNSADSFLKHEFFDSLKYFVDLHEDFSENFWRGVSFCDFDDEDCEAISSFASNDFPFFIYPFDGQTSGVSSYFFVNISFYEEMNPNSLSVQSQSGACTNTIQISTNNFSTCLGATLEADSFFAIIYNNDISFQENITYKIKIISIQKADGTNLLPSPYVMQTGFTVSPSLYAISNELVYDDWNYAVWTRCVLGKSWDGLTCNGTPTNIQFCTSNDDSCNGNVIGGFVTSGPFYDACENLNTIQYGGVIGWRTPYLWEMSTFNSYSNLPNVVSDYETVVWTANSNENNSTQAHLSDNSTDTKNQEKPVRCISNFVPSLF